MHQKTCNCRNIKGSFKKKFFWQMRFLYKTEMIVCICFWKVLLTGRHEKEVLSIITLNLTNKKNSEFKSHLHLKFFLDSPLFLYLQKRFLQIGDTSLFRNLVFMLDEMTYYMHILCFKICHF